MPVYGWDASDFDWSRGPMDLGAAARAGISFFTHKATENTNVKHIHFGEAMRRARDAGIPVLGAYHVVRSPRNARDEVDYFLNYVDRSFPEWRSHPAFFIQVDLEKWPYDSVPAAEGEDFADIAEAQTGKRAIIYASQGQYGEALAGTSHELWNANYPLGYRTGTYLELYRLAGGDNGAGWAPYSGKVPAIWQYTSSAVIGSQPTCDANAFRGTLDQLRALITGKGDDMSWNQDIAYGNTPAGVPVLADGKEHHEAWEWLVLGVRNAYATNQKLDTALAKVDTVAGTVAELKTALDELRATPPGSVVITDEQLERVLRRVLGSVDGASPAQG